MHSLNLIPELANPLEPELNHEQKYLNFPCEVKLSMDSAFLAVTTVGGEVKLFKMPAIICPLPLDCNLLPSEPAAVAQPPAKGAKVAQPTSPPPTI